MKLNNNILDDELDSEVSDDIIELVTDDVIEGERIDKYLSLRLLDYSRSYLKGLIDEGLVLVEGKVVKSSFKVFNGMTITVNIPPVKEVEIVPEDITLDILYEDEDVILINKPKGMVVHPAAGHFTGTLVNALMHHCKNNLSGINGELRPGIVHRIDMDTTGVIIVCKNDVSHRIIASQLKEHSIKRKYQAIVYGAFKEESGTVSGAIGRSKSDRKKMAITPDGKPAITHYKVIRNFTSSNGNNFAHIECELETGRTHQIRVHMTSIGHPLVGDEVYGVAKNPFKLQGQALHAEMLGFIHPKTGEYMEFHAPLPEYFTKLLDKLGN
ncbi:MAG: RluA family pseudouridine synthase [Peptoanaerobacter stomatis]|uniref:RluA family pseudouridine synthase n=1 Tax=Peptoanaerobacter stomatis TaxID=796937 RepID=UPI003FA14B60